MKKNLINNSKNEKENLTKLLKDKADTLNNIFNEINKLLDKAYEIVYNNYSLTKGIKEIYDLLALYDINDTLSFLEETKIFREYENIHSLLCLIDEFFLNLSLKNSREHKINVLNILLGESGYLKNNIK